MTRPTAEDLKYQAELYATHPDTQEREELVYECYLAGLKTGLDAGMHWEEVTPENPVPRKDIENGYYDFLFIIKGSGRKLCSWDMTDEDLDWYLDMVTHFLRVKLPVKREVGE